MDERAQQEKGHSHTLGWRPQGCPIQGEGSQGAVVATCRMASPRDTQRSHAGPSHTEPHQAYAGVASISPASCSSGHPISRGAIEPRGQTCQQPEGGTTTHGLYVQRLDWAAHNSAKTSRAIPRGSQTRAP